MGAVDHTGAIRGGTVQRGTGEYWVGNLENFGFFALWRAQAPYEGAQYSAVLVSASWDFQELSWVVLLGDASGRVACGYVHEGSQHSRVQVQRGMGHGCVGNVAGFPAGAVAQYLQRATVLVDGAS